MSSSSIEISWEASSSESSSKEIITQSKEIITPSRTTFKIEHQIGGTLSDWLIALHHDDNKQWEEFCQRANQAIQDCNYEYAIDYLTKAIQLKIGKNEKLLLDRAYCYQKLNQFEKALEDAESVLISKDSQSKYALIIKGFALIGMEKFQLAFNVLKEANKLPIKCDFVTDAIREIKRNSLGKMLFEDSEIDECDDLDTFDAMAKLIIQNKKSKGSSLLKPTNPFRSTSLQINGIAPDLNRKKLQEMLKEITGPLMEFKMHRSDNGSRVTLKFFDAQSARNAFAKIKQEELDGNLGLLMSDANLDIKLNIPGNQVIEYQEKNLEEIVGECLKWRTIGCDDDACQFLHIPVCKQTHHQLVKELKLKRTIDQDNNMQYESDIQRDIFKRIKSEKMESEMMKPSDREMVSYDDLF